MQARTHRSSELCSFSIFFASCSWVRKRPSSAVSRCSCSRSALRLSSSRSATAPRSRSRKTSSSCKRFSKCCEGGGGENARLAQWFAQRQCARVTRGVRGKGGTGWKPVCTHVALVDDNLLGVRHLTHVSLCLEDLAALRRALRLVRRRTGDALRELRKQRVDACTRRAVPI